MKKYRQPCSIYGMLPRERLDDLQACALDYVEHYLQTVREAEPVTDPQRLRAIADFHDAVRRRHPHAGQGAGHDREDDRQGQGAPNFPRDYDVTERNRRADDRLPVATYFGYGVGQIGGQILRDTPALILPIYMTTVLGMEAALGGS